VENNEKITIRSRGRKRNRVKEVLLKKKERRGCPLLSSVADAQLGSELELDAHTSVERSLISRDLVVIRVGRTG
jgi:hypothetical protein